MAPELTPPAPAATHLLAVSMAGRVETDDALYVGYECALPWLLQHLLPVGDALGQPCAGPAGA